MVKASLLMLVTLLITAPITASVPTNRTSLVEKSEERITLTSQIPILDLEYSEGLLVINLDEKAVNYGGGNAEELELINKLLEWGYDVLGAERITLLVNGSVEGFPEGNRIHQQSK